MKPNVSVVFIRKDQQTTESIRQCVQSGRVKLVCFRGNRKKLVAKLKEILKLGKIAGENSNVKQK